MSEVKRRIWYVQKVGTHATAPPNCGLLFFEKTSWVYRTINFLSGTFGDGVKKKQDNMGL